jgi:hypothetical protein
MFVNQELEAQVLAALAAAGSGRFYELVDLLPLAAFPVHATAYAALSDAFAAGKPVPMGALPEAELPAGFNLDAAAAELAALAQKRLVAEALEAAWRDLPTRDATVVIAELQAAAEQVCVLVFPPHGGIS